MGCLFSIFQRKNDTIPLISTRNEVYFINNKSESNKPESNKGEISPPGYNEVDDYYDELNRPYSFTLQRRHSLQYGWD